MPSLSTPADALPLLAFKIAPRQFDVSYRFAHISVRDQIVRAQMLVRTLSELRLVKPTVNDSASDFQLLICGAGAAGLAAAREASALGISFILIEKEPGAPGGILRSRAARCVSTAMYEWPNPNHVEHGFPLSTPPLLASDKPLVPTLQLDFESPVPIKVFGDEIHKQTKLDIAQWRQNFLAFVAGSSPEKRSLFVDRTVLHPQSKDLLRAMLDQKVSIHGVPLRSAKLPRLQLQHSAPSRVTVGLQFQYVIYAVGFSNELATFADGKFTYKGYKHKSFWKQDQIRKMNLGFSQPPRVGILGSGDGALQEALRCLTRRRVAHPLALWDRIMKFPQEGGRRPLRNSPFVSTAMAERAAADFYTTGGGIWTHRTHIFKSLDEAFKAIIKRLLRSERKGFERAIHSLIRDDVRKVTVVTQTGYFTRAYALNRFLVLLLADVLGRPGSSHSRKLELLSGHVTKFAKLGSSLRGASIVVDDNTETGQTRDCELLIIRRGLDRDTSPSQLVGLSGMDTGRAELGRIPPPIRPIGFADRPV